MKRIELYIIPYARENEVKTRLIVDGNRINSKDNRLTNLVVYQPMGKWLNPYKKKLFVWDGLLAEIIEEFNDKSIRFIFHGSKSDYILFKKSILTQQMKLTRNGGAVEVVFEFVDQWNPKKSANGLTSILDDMQVEADKWGETDIIKEIDCLKRDVYDCKVALKSELLSSSTDFQNMLQDHQIGTEDDAAVTVIPVDGSVSVSDTRDYITALIGKNDSDKKYIVVNTLPQESDELLDAVSSFDAGGDTGVRYIENDGENYIEEIKKIYYLSMFPCFIQKAAQILLMFPDHDTNIFLIDISDRIEELFHVNL